MDSQEQQVVDRIKQANNVLVTVSANPTVDQLAACLGLTIMLNGLGKHAAAVFSGTVPSTIEFLQPEKTIEKNTDSLRDFIISLDKAKADKLRYKVEDKVVKIFITPYRTSISEKDFEFSQGDFNVEVVIALGVHEQKDLDQAITAHGRILHDATVVAINTTAGNNLGAINWQDAKASSLSEMVTHLSDSFDKKVLDNQVATALLTGIVAETGRFSNSRTTPETMKASAQLMAAGANQQLVATKLQAPPPPVEPIVATTQDLPVNPEPAKPSDGTLRIDHPAGNPPESSEPENEQEEKSDQKEPEQKVEPKSPEPKKEEPQIHIDDQGNLRLMGQNRPFLSGPGPVDVPQVIPAMDDEEKPSGMPNNPQKFVDSPPAFGGPLTANSSPEGLEPSIDSLLSSNGNTPLLEHSNGPSAPPKVSAGNPPAGSSPAPSVSTTPIPDFTLPEPTVAPVAPTPLASPSKPAEPATDDHQTLSDLEEAVGSPHVNGPDVGNARDAVSSAIHEGGAAPPLGPIAALNAQPLGDVLHQSGSNVAAGTNVESTPPAGKLVEPLAGQNLSKPAQPSGFPLPQPSGMSLPPTLTPPPASTTPPTSSSNGNPSAPPPVPPPMMPFITPNGQ
jgi:hypothetical protein